MSLNREQTMDHETIHSVEIRRKTFKHFVAEETLGDTALVSLKNHNNGKSLHLYLSGINAVLAVAPKLFKILSETSTEGEDEEIYSEELKSYGNKKIMASVKRFRNKTSVCIHLMFDENKTGEYRHTRCQIQLSPEDNLEDLREFAQAAKRSLDDAKRGKPEYTTIDMAFDEGEESLMEPAEDCNV